MLLHRALWDLFSVSRSWLLPVVILLLAAVAFASPRLASRTGRIFQAFLRGISARRATVVCCIALAVGLVAGFSYAERGLPIPWIHDEFSYLLAADTFAQGRLTNPAHPLPQFFEAFHVNMLPTYASMYPPGQGLMLAAGETLLGSAWAGVILSCVVLCPLIAWALAGWMPRSWALLGGLMSVSLVCFGSGTPAFNWLTGYWGGSLAAIGGALVIGAWPRVRKNPRPFYGVLLGFGLVVLANTRMYEGAVLSGLVALHLTYVLLIRPSRPRGLYLRRVLLPTLCVLVPAACWMMFYFWRVTGSPFLMPYVLNYKTYFVSSLFYFGQNRPEPLYNHDVMRRMYETGYFLPRSDPQFWIIELRPTLDQFGGSLLLLLPAAVWKLGRDRKVRVLLSAAGAMVLAAFLSAWIRPHYVAPALVVFVGLIVQTLRYIRTLRMGKVRVGAFVVPALLALWFASQWLTGVHSLASGRTAPEWAIQRSRIERFLRDDGDRHLIFVRYEAEHDPNQGWVHDGADLMNAPILWARDMGTDADRALISLYPGRKIWLIEPDRSFDLHPYSGD